MKRKNKKLIKALRRQVARLQANNHSLYDAIVRQDFSGIPIYQHQILSQATEALCKELIKPSPWP